MKYSVQILQDLSIGHTGAECGSSFHHGHKWRVTATFEGAPVAPTNAPMALTDIERAQMLILEYDLRDINIMVEPGVPSIWGFANVLWDRLAVFDHLISVEVYDSSLRLTAGVSRG